MGKRIAVIGGGASGLMAAITAAECGATVTIFESKERLGKKILATGNGKCNYTNLVQEDACYRGSHPEFSVPAREQFTVAKTLEFFESIGIPAKIKNGYVYPNSEQAASVADALSLEVRGLGIGTVQETVKAVKKAGTVFKVMTATRSDSFDRVIFAMGSCAGMKDVTQFSGYRLCEEQGHRIVKVLPALVQLRCAEKWFKTIAGVRTEGKITLFENGKEIASEQGELLFAEYGLSGIPVFQISRFAAEALQRNGKVTGEVDFFPDRTKEELIQHISTRVERCKNRTTEEVLTGLLNHKLNYVLLKLCGLEPTAPAKKEWTQNAICKMAGLYKKFTCQVTETNPFSNAQVCAGGVDTTEIKAETMESGLVDGLYFAGELVDIEGTCGGYNLQWAWSSGYVAGLHAAQDAEK